MKNPSPFTLFAYIILFYYRLRGFSLLCEIQVPQRRTVPQYQSTSFPDRVYRALTCQKCRLELLCVIAYAYPVFSLFFLGTPSTNLRLPILRYVKQLIRCELCFLKPRVVLALVAEWESEELKSKHLK